LNKFLWVLPTVFSILLIEAAYIWGFWIPTPFLATVAGVVIAGSWGGRWPGLLAATVAALALLHAYIAQFFPMPMTENLPAFVVTVSLYFATAYFLGGLRDQRDESINALREIERNLASLLLDETSAKETQTALVAHRQTRLDAANRLAGIGHFSFDARSGDCTFCSEQHAANLGVTAVEFQRMTTGREPHLKHIHPDDHQLVLASIHQLNLGKGQAFEYRAFHPGNEVRFIRQIEEPVFDEAGNVIEHFGTSMDMTELRRAEIRLRQSQRIEAIGTLTGGVAHDFNNLLAIILGNLELCLDAEQDADRQDFIQSSIRATLRGAGLTKKST
jgi:PAS domain-containing protein